MLITTVPTKTRNSDYKLIKNKVEKPPRPVKNFQLNFSKIPKKFASFLIREEKTQGKN